MEDAAVAPEAGDLLRVRVGDRRSAVAVEDELVLVVAVRQTQRGNVSLVEPVSPLEHRPVAPAFPEVVTVEEVGHPDIDLPGVRCGDPHRRLPLIRRRTRTIGTQERACRPRSLVRAVAGASSSGPVAVASEAGEPKGAPWTRTRAPS